MLKNVLIVLLATILLVGIIDKSHSCPPEKLTVEQINKKILIKIKNLEDEMKIREAKLN